MSLIYSTRFILSGSAPAGTLTFSVPSGFVAVVRDVDVTFPAPAPAGSASLAIAGAYAASSPDFPAAFGSWQWRGRQVAYAFELVELGVAIAGTAVLVSGYLLAT